MDITNRTNRPGLRPSELSHPNTSGQSKQIAKTPKQKRKLLFIIPVAAVLMAGATLIYVNSMKNNIASAIDSSKYQVIVLKDSSGSPNYFGKLSVINNDYMRLSDVYYLQKKSNDSPTPDTSVGTIDLSDYQLTKLGNEIHAPEDEMLIHTNQILYFENLKPSGAISKTITDSKKTN